MRTRTILVATVTVGGLLAASSPANAVGFTGDNGFLDIGGSFGQIKVPGATSTYAEGTNNSG
jgi:hypothetical protein